MFFEKEAFVWSVKTHLIHEAYRLRAWSKWVLVKERWQNITLKIVTFVTQNPRKRCKIVAYRQKFFSLHKYCRHRYNEKNNKSTRNISHTFIYYQNQCIFWNTFWGLTTEWIVPVSYSDRKSQSIFKAHGKFWKQNVSHEDALSSILKAN